MLKSIRKFLMGLIATALIAMCATISGVGATLDEYLGQLDEIDGLLGELHYYLDEVAEVESEDPDFEKEVIDEILAMIVKPQTVEVGGHEVRVDNSWISVELAYFVDRQQEQNQRRLRIVSVRERILAVKKRISELRGATEGTLSKDEQKQKLAEILSRVDYAKPPEQKEGWLTRTLRKIDEWLGSKLPEPNIPTSAPEGIKGISVVLQAALYALLAALIIFLLYKFLPVLLRNFRNRERRDKGSRVILGEILDADETSASLFDEAEALARAGDLRAAIRKGYIAFLCELSDRRLVGLAQHKTNRDYLRDVRKEPRIHRGLSGLTDRFERHWYGVEDADETAWQEFRETYRMSLEKG